MNSLWLLFDEVIRPLAESELHQIVCDNRLEASQSICAFKGAYRTNHEKLSNKPTCSRNVTQQGSCSKLNQSNRSSHERDIKFSNQNSFRPVFAYGPENVFHSPEQQLYRPNPTWRIFLDLSWIQQDQYLKKYSPDREDIKLFPKQGCLVPYKEIWQNKQLGPTYVEALNPPDQIETPKRFKKRQINQKVSQYKGDASFHIWPLLHVSFDHQRLGHLIHEFWCIKHFPYQA